MSAAGRAVFPGSFDPPTVAHIAMARTACRQPGLASVEFVVSTAALGKEAPARPSLADRFAVVERAAADAGFTARLTEAQLVVDIARGYDAAIVGADKYWQLHDERFYDSPAHRDAALAALPPLLVVPRAGQPPPTGVHVLDIGPDLMAVSSTAARRGARHLMAPAAAAFDAATGAWSDPDRYDRWRREGRPAGAI